jgi:hypothetical protein
MATHFGPLVGVVGRLPHPVGEAHGELGEGRRHVELDRRVASQIDLGGVGEEVELQAQRRHRRIGVATRRRKLKSAGVEE